MRCISSWLLPVPALALLCAACATPEATSQPVVEREHVLRPAPAMERIAGSDGAMQRILYSVPVRGGRLEIRTLVLLPSKGLVLTADHEAAFELRSGSVRSGATGEAVQRSAGDIWTARAGDRIAFQVTSETAVVRAIVFVPMP